MTACHSVKSELLIR